MEPLSSSLPSNKSSCAFPSWPKRSSLHSLHCDQASSYISDADLFPPEPVAQLSTFENELSIHDIVAMRLVEEIPAATDVPALVPDGPSRSVTERLLALRDGSRSSRRPKNGKRKTSERKSRRRSGNMAPIEEAVE
ncbi:MAG: hypothetical protein M1812_005203 [Candelaria pacifica]|nr:MAG: hypothetical protein M1812_005203 [Candelaria pacifica]